MLLGGVIILDGSLGAQGLLVYVASFNPYRHRRLGAGSFRILIAIGVVPRNEWPGSDADQFLWAGCLAFFVGTPAHIDSELDLDGCLHFSWPRE